jgi:two-component sensor histidine kinase
MPIKSSVWNRILEGGEQGSFEDQGSDGIPRIFAFRSLILEGSSEPYMYVVYATPKADVVAGIRSLLFRNIFLMIGVTVFSLICAALLSRKFFEKRLNTIITTATRLREGDLSARVDLGEDVSDLGQIGVALNLMAETLERREAEIETASRPLATAVVHEMLKDSNGKGMVSLGPYAERLTGLIADSWKSSVDFSIQADDIRCSIDTAVPFGLVLNELVVNAFKHAFKNKDTGHLTVSIRNQDLQIILEVADDGPGLPPSFSMDDSPGLGLRIARATSLQISGSLTWSEGGGARFRLSFPIPDSQSTAQA